MYTLYNSRKLDFYADYYFFSLIYLRITQQTAFVNMKYLIMGYLSPSFADGIS